MTENVDWRTISVHELARVMHDSARKLLIIDSRSFLEFNASHIVKAVNVSSSKLIKRRLQQDKLSVQELLSTCCHDEIDLDSDIVVYDQCTADPTQLTAECFLVVFINKLQGIYNNVFLLKGGFLEFQATNPSQCRIQTSSTSTSGGYKCPPMTSMSQPCLPVSNVGPTKILPFLFLGSQQDALSQETMQQNGITYVLNVSTTSPKPGFIQEGHFLRVPVNDSYCDKLLPFFHDAFQFLDKVRESNSCALIHCLAGISRSPTLAIAYIMRYLGLSTDEAYKYVKDKRPTISPNFNFLGQLLEYEQILRDSSSEAAPLSTAVKKSSSCTIDLLSPPSPATISVTRSSAFPAHGCLPSRTLSLHSPTTAFAKLNFSTHPSPVVEETSPTSAPCDEDPARSSADAASHDLQDLAVYAQISSAPFDEQLDQLSFTTCHACVDALIPLIGCGVMAGSSRSGAKRTLDDDRVAVCDSTFESAADCSVALRSHGLQAKRLLVRPSSIAFCSLPPSDADDHISTAFDISSGGCIADVSCAEHIQQQRKSRSLEDILNSPVEESGGRCPPGRGMSECVRGSSVAWPPPPSAAEILEPSTYNESRTTTTSLRWWPVVAGSHSTSTAPEQHRNESGGGGSLSSGSRNSLHGSVEVIEVS